jgi:hypothetical protein
MLQKNDWVELKFAAQLRDQGWICFKNEIDVIGRVKMTWTVREWSLIHFLDLLD